ncbi:unnamed protein product [Arctogadus glacialis]
MTVLIAPHPSSLLSGTQDEPFPRIHCVKYVKDTTPPPCVRSPGMSSSKSMSSCPSSSLLSVDLMSEDSHACRRSSTIYLGSPDTPRLHKLIPNPPGVGDRYTGSAPTSIHIAAPIGHQHPG